MFLLFLVGRLRCHNLLYLRVLYASACNVLHVRFYLLPGGGQEFLTESAGGGTLQLAVLEPEMDEFLVVVLHLLWHLNKQIQMNSDSDYFMNKQEPTVLTGKEFDMEESDVSVFDDHVPSLHQCFSSGFVNQDRDERKKSAGFNQKGFGYFFTALKMLQDESLEKSMQKEECVYYAKEIHMTFRLHTHNIASVIEGILPSSMHPIKAFEKAHDVSRDVSLRKSVDMCLVSKTFQSFSDMTLYDLYFRTITPIKISRLQEMIDTFSVTIVNQIIHEHLFDISALPEDNQILIIATALNVQDIELCRSQSYMRSQFFQRALSVVSFPDDLLFFWINHGNDSQIHVPDLVIKDNLVCFRQPQLPVRLGSSQTAKFATPRQKNVDVAEQVWIVIKTTFNKQLWHFISGIMFNDQRTSFQHRVQKKMGSQNLFELFPKLYKQTGFVDPILQALTTVELESSQSQMSELINRMISKYEQQRADGHQMIQQQGKEIFREWQRNKSIQILSRCLFMLTIEEVRDKNSDMEQFVSGDNFKLVVTKYDNSLYQLLKQHMSIDEDKIVIHPHPAISLKSQLYGGHSLMIDEPLFLGPLYATAAGSAISTIAYQLFCIDANRSCDQGAILMCGESRSGKSVIKDSVFECFNGYDWRKMNGNFQSRQILTASVVCVEEIETKSFSDDKHGMNMWKKRLDQTIGCDIDVKQKDGSVCMLHMPFVLTTNEKPNTLHSKVDHSFFERIRIIYFPQSILQMKKDMEKLEKSGQDKLQGLESWSSKKNAMTQKTQKQMMGNLITLFALLYPHHSEGKRDLFIDDLLCEHIVKLLVFNKHSAFLFFYFKKQGNLILEELFKSHMDLFNIKNKTMPASQSWVGYHRYMITEQTGYLELVKAMVEMCYPEDEAVRESVMDKMIDARTSSFALSTLFSEISLDLSLFQSQTYFRYYDSLASLKLLIDVEVPDSNMKKHILLCWDRTLQRLGL